MKLYSLYFMSFHFKLIDIIITVIVLVLIQDQFSLLQCCYKSSGQ